MGIPKPPPTHDILLHSTPLARTIRGRGGRAVSTPRGAVGRGSGGAIGGRRAIATAGCAAVGRRGGGPTSSPWPPRARKPWGTIHAPHHTGRHGRKGTSGGSQGHAAAGRTVVRVPGWWWVSGGFRPRGSGVDGVTGEGGMHTPVQRAGHGHDTVFHTRLPPPRTGCCGWSTATGRAPDRRGPPGGETPPQWTPGCH
jgi:hypothetical protein